MSIIGKGLYLGNDTAEEVPENDVIFIDDYIQGIAYSYSAEEFLALEEMPANPMHDGVVGLGWNWTLADAKEYVQSYGALVIGQEYRTQSGKTELYLTLETEKELTVGIIISLSAAGNCEIYWGDDSRSTIVTKGQSILKHIYSSIGDYKITIDSDVDYTVDAMYQYITPFYATSLRELRGGTNLTSAKLGYNYNLSRALLPYATVTSTQKCVMLNTLTVSKNTTLGSYALYSSPYKYVSLPKLLATIPQYNFNANHQLRIITLPPSMTSISNGSFSELYDCSNIILPNSITSIGQQAFSSCSKLKYIKIPSGVTQIAKSILDGCDSLQEVRILGDITSIASRAFYGVPADIYFMNCTSVPVLENADAFSNKCTIHIPIALETQWEAAAQWSTHASQIIGE